MTDEIMKALDQELKELEVEMTQLRADADSKLQEYNRLYLDGEIEQALAMAGEVGETCNQYTARAKRKCYLLCLENEDPMRAACEKLEYATIAVKDEKTDEDSIPVRRLTSRTRPIDLLDLHKLAKDRGLGGIGVNHDWNAYVQKLNLLMTVLTAKELGVPADRMKEINDSYNMSVIAHSIELGENPTSNTKMLKTLTTVVRAMIGEEYKPISKDVKFVEYAYRKKSRRALTITVANHKTMRNLLMEVCNRLITDGVYDVDCKEIKKQK